VVGVVETYGEAVALIGCRPAGDWWLTDKPAGRAGDTEGNKPCHE
jgi:hypothetical protein